MPLVCGQLGLEQSSVLTLESYFFKGGWISSWTPHPLPALPEGGTALEQMEISSGQGGLSWLRFSQQGSASHCSFFHSLISASMSAVTKPLTHFFYGPKSATQRTCAAPRSQPLPASGPGVGNLGV